MTTYNYTKSPVALDRLTQEIQNAQLATALDYVTGMTLLGSALAIPFMGDLSGGDKSTLDTVVANHGGTPLPQSTTQNVAIQSAAISTDRFVTGTLTAFTTDANINSATAGSTLVVDCSGCATVVNTTVTTWTGGTVVMDLSYDGGNTWWITQVIDPAIGPDQDCYFTEWSYTDNNDPWVVNCAGATHCRLRANSAISGTLLATLTATPTVHYVKNAPISYRYMHISGTGTTTVKTGVTKLCRITINTGAALGDTLTVYDSTTNSGAVVAIVTITTSAVAATLDYGNIILTNGLTVHNSGLSDFTISYQ